MDEKKNDHARTETATCLNLRGKAMRDSRDGKVIAGSQEPLSAQRVKDMVGNARENIKLWECRQQGGRKVCMDFAMVASLLTIKQLTALYREK